MESLNSIPVAVGLGILIGFVAGWLSRSGSGAKSKELQQSKDEIEQYRKDVTAHFEKTAMLVGSMTEQYRAVYDHLADGAQNLCNDPTARLDVIGQGEALIAAPEAGRNAKPVMAAKEVTETTVDKEPTAASSADETGTTGDEERLVSVAPKVSAAAKPTQATPAEERTAP